MISRLHIPVQSPEDVIPHLGKPTHYKAGRSAFCLVNSWLASGGGLPRPIVATLATTPALAEASLIEGFLEREVDLGDGRKPSQTDLLAILRIAGTLVVMSVEAKVDEPFGNLVRDELVHVSATKRKRIDRLSAMLAISPADVSSLRYQLIHRTAAAVLEAKRFCSEVAVMMVQSFDPQQCGIEDFRRFAMAIGVHGAGPGFTAGPVSIGGVKLYLGWTADRP